MPYPMNYQMFQPQYIQQPQQIQNGGLVSVRGEMEARNYPVAPGNSVTFKDETAPYVYTKTMGFSQLDRPTFEKFKLVKEDPAEQTEAPLIAPEKQFASISSIDELHDQIDALWREIEGLKQKRTPQKKEKEAEA